MARIHGISGSTRYLLNGTRPINGRRLSNLDDITDFHDNFTIILAEKEAEVSVEQDALITSLAEDEIRLDKQIQADVARRTREVYTHILDINTKIESAPTFFPYTAYIIQFWMANLLSYPRINFPSCVMRWNLYLTRNRKTSTIANKPRTVRNACRNIVETQNFLLGNATFLAGAHGEEEIIGALSALPDEYHVLNDVNLRFEKAIHWKKHREYIKTCQIDHIVVGPTGLFLLETKNWTKSNMQYNSELLIHQVNRASLSLWFYLKDHYWRNETPPIRKVVVSLHGFASSQKADPFIDAVVPDRLCDFITSRDVILTNDAIHKLVRLIPCRE